MTHSELIDLRQLTRDLQACAQPAAQRAGALLASGLGLLIRWVQLGVDHREAALVRANAEAMLDAGIAALQTALTPAGAAELPWAERMLVREVRALTARCTARVQSRALTRPRVGDVVRLQPRPQKIA